MSKRKDTSKTDAEILPVGGPRRLPELDEAELREREERIAREAQETGE